MKVFFILIFFSFTLATCQEECIGSFFLPEIKDDIPVLHSTCPDQYDGKEHLLGSTWDTDHCFRCVCHGEGSHCCKRHVGVNHRPGCITVVNPKTCEYDFYLVEASSMALLNLLDSLLFTRMNLNQYFLFE
ncbi:small serum protein 4-like [Ahaetulla prasina]|uniref:small serum protein 4-like n=1 Tax=Ahaetulla prasina TaxID=499056 RepID=UPI0026480FE1|nr:small serum protein 4-like [Ahaetulla prasina]